MLWWQVPDKNICPLFGSLGIPQTKVGFRIQSALAPALFLGGKGEDIPRFLSMSEKQCLTVICSLFSGGRDDEARLFWVVCTAMPQSDLLSFLRWKRWLRAPFLSGVHSSASLWSALFSQVEKMMKRSFSEWRAQQCLTVICSFFSGGRDDKARLCSV